MKNREPIFDKIDGKTGKKWKIDKETLEETENTIQTMQGMKSQEKLEGFVAYCFSNPEERFWQALRNWSGYEKIFGEHYNEEVDDYVLKDTFYIE